MKSLRNFKEQRDRSWESLQPWGNNKILKSTSWLLLVVPLIARNADLIPWEIKLPFRWLLLWFSALFFSVANGLFVWRCPRIVKQYKNYPEFDLTKRGFSKLNELFIDTYLAIGGNSLECNFSEAIQLMSSKAFPDEQASKSNNGELPVGLQTIYQELSGGLPYTEQSFNWLYSIANRSYPITRHSIHILYIFGLIGVGVVAIENIFHVFKFLF